jgi:hypothetical protein
MPILTKNQWPVRLGLPPQVMPCAPQGQLDQLPPEQFKAVLLERLRDLAGVTFASSQRAPYGTIGLHLKDQETLGREHAFLIDQEFAHVHPDEDSSMHMILPEPVRSQAIAAGWALPHPLAGKPTVSPDTVLVYAPRNQEELETVAQLTRVAWLNARGE